MTIKNELELINKRTDLSLEEKTLQRYFAKGTILLKKANDLIDSPFLEWNIEITITNVLLDEKGQLRLWFKARRSDVDVPIPLSAFPFIIVNPPVSIRDPFGNEHENPEEAIKKLLVSLVKMY